jgi:hypothetical protein
LPWNASARDVEPERHVDPLPPHRTRMSRPALVRRSACRGTPLALHRLPSPLPLRHAPRAPWLGQADPAAAPNDVPAVLRARTPPCRAHAADVSTTWHCANHLGQPPIKGQEPRSRVTTRVSPPAPWLLSTSSSHARVFPLPSSLSGVSPRYCRRSRCCVLPGPVCRLARAPAPVAVVA